jgi:hypothetical protein
MSKTWKPTLGVTIRRGACFNQIEVSKPRALFDLSKMGSKAADKARRGVVDTWRTVTGRKA